MNKENAVLFLPLIKALALGETLQRKSNNEWYDLTDVHFNTRPECYRIKPKDMFVVCGENATFISGGVYSDTRVAKDVLSRMKGDVAPYKVYQLVEVPAA